MPHEPEVSVIICSRDRPKPLMDCLASVVTSIGAAGLTAEIVLVENGSQSGLEVDAAELASVTGGLCRHVKLARGSLSEARNVGMGRALGRLLVFVDDDCVLEPAYMADMRRHAGAMGADGVAHYLIGGRVKLGDPRDLPFTIKDEAESRTFDVGLHPGGFIQGCNFFLPRETARRIGWFDTRFGAGARFRAGEDTDYLIRAHAAGVMIRYVPDMVVHHRHGRRTFSEVDRLNRNYAFANGAILAKHLRRHPWLAKHLAWTLRSALLERVGGPRFDAAVGLSWASVVRAQARGVLAFTADWIRQGRTVL